MENMLICTKPLPDTRWVWVTQQWMSAKATAVPTSVTRWKLQVEQPVTAPSVLTGAPCNKPSSTSALPASGRDQGHYTPAKTSLSQLPHFSQALKESKDKIQLMEYGVPECHWPHTDLGYFPNHLLPSVDILVTAVKPNLGKICKCSWLLG